jgi:SAM-dependent methyltransferase
VILRKNLAEIVARARAASRVLDVGGWFLPLNVATHVLDLGPMETRGTPLDPENPPRFTKESWTIADACVAPWPYPDKYFDFSICSHLLEDVRDPLAVIRELRRVAKAGYVETPSRLREIFAKGRFDYVKSRLFWPPAVGFHHHRWFVEAKGHHFVFTAKTAEVTRRRRYYLTRGEIGRKLGDEESGLGFFWEGELTAEEFFPSSIRDDLAAYKRRAIEALRRGRDER